MNQPQPLQYHGYKEDGQPICGAKTRSGGVCQNKPVSGRVRCRMHGGKMPRGEAHPRYKDGRYITSMPRTAPLIQKIAEQMSDERSVALTDELALHRARIAQLVERLVNSENGDIGVSYRMASEAHSKLQQAMSNPTAPGATVLLNEGMQLLGKALSRMAVERESWDEMRDATGIVQRLTDTELRRMKNDEEMVHNRDLMHMFVLLQNAILEVVTTPEDRRRIKQAFIEVISIQPTAVLP